MFVLRLKRRHRNGSNECFDKGLGLVSPLQHEMLADVAVGSITDICSAQAHVRFTTESRHSPAAGASWRLLGFYESTPYRLAWGCLLHPKLASMVTVLIRLF